MTIDTSQEELERYRCSSDELRYGLHRLLDIEERLLGKQPYPKSIDSRDRQIVLSELQLQLSNEKVLKLRSTVFDYKKVLSAQAINDAEEVKVRKDTWVVSGILALLYVIQFPFLNQSSGLQAAVLAISVASLFAAQWLRFSVNRSQLASSCWAFERDIRALGVRVLTVKEYLSLQAYWDKAPLHNSDDEEFGIRELESDYYQAILRLAVYESTIDQSTVLADGDFTSSLGINSFDDQRYNPFSKPELFSGGIESRWTHLMRLYRDKDQ